MKELKWHNEKRLIKDLIPFESNPRQLSKEQYEQLKKSLSKFDLAEIPVIDTDNKIVAGHQRLKILAEIKGKDYEIDVRVPNRKLTENEFKEYNVRSNKNTGSWDFDILSNDFNLTDLLEWGFEESELTPYFDEEIKEDEIPEVPKETKIKIGDKFQLDRHILVCGDCTLKENYQSVCDMVFTDPPYDMEMNLLELVLDNIDVVANKNIFVMAIDIMAKDILKYVNWKFHQFNIFEVPFSIPAGNYFYRQHIPILHFTKGKIDWINCKKGYTSVFKSSKYRGGTEDSEKHKHSKPIEFVVSYLESFRCENVLDPFGGYGGTLIASEQLNKSCYMIEINPYYCDLIIQRWENLTSKKAKKLN